MKFFIKLLFVLTSSLLLTRFIIPHQPFLLFYANHFLYRSFIQEMPGDDAGNLIEFLAISSELLVSILASIAILKLIQCVLRILKGGR